VGNVTVTDYFHPSISVLITSQPARLTATTSNAAILDIECPLNFRRSEYSNTVPASVPSRSGLPKLSMDTRVRRAYDEWAALPDYDVTRTSTDMPAKASVIPTKLPDTGIACRMSRTTATGISLKPPTLRLVGSNVIQPAPGTKTSAHAWVDPASVDPTLC